MQESASGGVVVPMSDVEELELVVLLVAVRADEAVAVVFAVDFFAEGGVDGRGDLKPGLVRPVPHRADVVRRVIERVSVAFIGPFDHRRQARFVGGQFGQCPWAAGCELIPKR